MNLVDVVEIEMKSFLAVRSIVKAHFNVNLHVPVRAAMIRKKNKQIFKKISKINALFGHDFEITSG